MKPAAGFVCSATLMFLGSVAAGQAPPARDTPPAGSGPSVPESTGRPSEQTRFDISVEGISAVELAWWFQHIADNGGEYWKSLAPAQNRSIEWKVNPREDAHQLIGSVYSSEQVIGSSALPENTLHTLVYFADYVTQGRAVAPGQVTPLNPTLAFPKDYTPRYPTPISSPAGFAGGPPIKSEDNGFNEDMILLDGMGFAPGRVLWSWRNTGNDDTPATAHKPKSIALTVTLYQPWMEGGNRPPALKQDGYYYSPAQVQAIWSAWETLIKALPAKLPAWFGSDTQDELARAKGWTVGAVVDTGLVEGVDSKMMVWWWNHAMGDAPGTYYTLWCPPAHYTIRWLPGFSPKEVLHSDRIPTDHVVPGIIYPDLQGDHLNQTGGGMMAFPPAMAPIPGRYKVLDPMMIVTKEQVDNFAKERFPAPKGWLLHQWEDRPGGLIHRSTGLAQLPLRSPITQQGLYSEHQLLEGQNWGSQGMRNAYKQWLKDHGTNK